MSIPILRSVVSLLVALAVTSIGLEAQFGRILRRTAEREATRKVEDVLRDAVRCAMGDYRCVEEAKQNGDEVVILDDSGEPILDEDGNPVTDPGEAALYTSPGEGIWRNFDFTPGRTVYFASDFSSERVGRFPSNQLEFVSGNMQVVDLEGAKVLEIASSSVFRVALPREVPNGFSVEFSYQAPSPDAGLQVLFAPLEGSVEDHDGQYLEFDTNPGIFRRGEAVSSERLSGGLADRLHAVKLQVDDGYAVLYVGAEQVANLPVSTIGGFDVIEFRAQGDGGTSGYINKMVVAGDLERFESAVERTGEFTTRGITFLSNTDAIHPQSTAALEDVRSVLVRKPNLEVTIEAHLGDGASTEEGNDLSKRRAEAIVAYLTARGVDASQVRAAGRGVTESVRDSASGRTENERIVIRETGG